MKLKMRLVSVCVALVLAIGLLVVGVFAASQGTVGFNGSVSFVANDVYCKVNGEVSGAQENVTLDEINFSATYEPDEELDSWANNDLNFIDKNSVIKFETTIENLSTERELYVDITDNIEVTENVDKVVKYEGGAYQLGEIKTLAPSTGEGTSVKTFVIELTVENKNKAVKSAGYDYTITLDNSNRSNNQNTQEKYTLTYDFSNIGDYTLEETTFEGKKAYQMTSMGDAYGYLVVDSLNGEYVSGDEVEFVVYFGIGSEISAKANGEELTPVYAEDEIYSIFTYKLTVTQNTEVVFEGFVW